MGEVVHDSIIENKEKTKNYWEQLMLAAGNNNCPSSSEVKRSNGLSLLTIPGSVARNLVDQEISSEPKIVETVVKKPPDLVTGSKVEDSVKASKRESVIELEIQSQKEREAAFAQERQEVIDISNRNGSIDSKGPFDRDESLNFSIPTSEEGNYPESGIDDKEHSFDETRLIMSRDFIVTRTSSHDRTQSLDSMSSGHSSGSIGSLSSGGAVGETIVFHIRRRPITVKPLDQPQEENLIEFVRSDKETPIQKEIRLSKEREEELRREKQLASTKDVSTKQCLSSLIVEPSPVVKRMIETTKSVPESVPLASGCVKKVIDRNRKGYVVKEFESLSNSTGREQQETLSIDKLSISKLDFSAKTSSLKLFNSTPSPYKKGLMNRFIASGGKIKPTFTFSAPITYKPVNKSIIDVPVSVSPEKVPNWKSLSEDKKQVPPLFMGTRPGYVSVEDKIQMELQEMRKREKELREQRNRMFIRSQPDLAHLLSDEEEKEANSQDEPFKLRSAQSNPNLLDEEDGAKGSTAQRKRNALIDVWENMIQKN